MESVYVVGNGNVYHDLGEPAKMAFLGGLGIVLIVIILVIVAKI